MNSRGELLDTRGHPGMPTQACLGLSHQTYPSQPMGEQAHQLGDVRSELGPDFIGLGRTSVIVVGQEKSLTGCSWPNV